MTRSEIMDAPVPSVSGDGEDHDIARTAKKKRKDPRPMSYAEKKKMENLESFLFGDGGEATRRFGREEAELNATAVAVATTTTTTTARGNADADKQQHHQPLLFFEDRGGAGRVEDGDGDGEAATAAAASTGRMTRRSAAAAAAAAASTAAPTATDAPTTPLTPPTTAANAARPPRSNASAAAWSDPYVETAVVDLAAGAARWRKLREDSEGGRDSVAVGGGEFERRLRRRVAATSGGRARAWAARAKADAARARAAAEKGARAPGATPDVLSSGASLLASPSAIASASSIASAAGSSRLEVSRLSDANAADASDAVVSSVDFHASGQLLLTAGMDKRLRFFQCDGARNAKLQSLFLRDMPIRQASFCGAGGDKALAVGRRPFLYLFDLGSGRCERVRKPLGREERTFEAFAVAPPSGGGGGSGGNGGGGGGGDVVALLGARGCILLLSLKSRCLAGELRTAGGTVRAAAFSNEGNTLYATGGDGVVHAWDLRMPRSALSTSSPSSARCVSRFVDEGCVRGTALACGGPWLATGSDSGVVNVYDRKSVTGGSSGGGGGNGRTGKISFCDDEDDEDDESDDDGDDDGAGGEKPKPLFRSPTAPTRPTPARSLPNLTTTVDTLCLSRGGEVMVMASRMRRDSLRVASGKDLKVYANWPSSRTPLGHVHCAALSPGGGMLAVGNAKGKCLLYRIHHLPVV